MNDRDFGLDRGEQGTFAYSSAMLFVLFAPGVVLLIFGGGKILIMPKAMIECAFSYVAPRPERLFLATITEKFNVFGVVEIGGFAALDTCGFLDFADAGFCAAACAQNADAAINRNSLRNIDIGSHAG